ncbi:MAG: insulinase family protein [Spirochaetota bacterium]|nr:MAG: insulinase family protein [Spirochaetota bacterium]
MKFERGKSYHGFTLEREKKIQEINGMGRIFLHPQSGARLCYLECDDDNKVFAIGFRTPPFDSTGTPHILEHSVLCGSRKFPSKEPFVELAKGSLHTFLNAMTYPDKTLYPVASKNERDLFNLMDVYLDAVLYPNIYKYQEIFMQEGWHYELTEKDGEISYKGVVYNEMKGAYSTPEEILFRKIHESLFPDNTYSYESGGDPDIIPELTYEKFLAFHRNFYHPSNSYIFLYGDLDINQSLRFLNKEYLKEFESIDIESGISLQKPFSTQQEMITLYPISEDEEEAEKAFFGLNWVLNHATNREHYLAFSILEHMLLDTPAAPLKIELLKKRLGKDVFGSLNRSILQPTLSVVLKHTAEGNKKKFLNTVSGTLERLVKEGIDKRLIEASINIHEFKLREADFRGLPKGLVYYIQIMDSWLYDADPFQHLEYEAVLPGIKKALKSDYFERLIKQYMLDNRHSSLIILKPKRGLEEERVKSVKIELDQFKKKLTDKEIGELVQNTNRLMQRQAEPDSEEALQSIPLLALKDIDPEAERLPLEEKEESKLKVLFHPIYTSGIVYLNLLFDSKAVPQTLLPYLSLLTAIMARVSTERFHYSDLSNEIYIHTGGIGFATDVYSNKESDKIFYPKIIVKSKAIGGKLDKLFELLTEIIGYTKFDDEKRLLEIIQETKSRMEIAIFEGGHIACAHRLFSYFSPIGKYNESLSGITFYKFISDLERDFKDKKDEVIATLQKVAELVFDRKNLIMSVTSEEDGYKLFQHQLPSFIDHLGDSEIKPQDYSWDFSEKNEGLLTPGKVQFVAKGYNFRRLGYIFSGTLDVLRTIASLDFLWNRIRVQGGAYGSFARFARNGNMYFCSYRDPGLKETLAVYDEAASYIQKFDPDEREMRKYIIGTIGGLDAPLTPSMKGEVATANYLSYITQEDIQQRRDEVLRIKKDDMKKCADMIRDLMKENYLCVVGNEGKLRENKDLFSKLVPVFTD